MQNWLNILGWTLQHLEELRFTGFDFLTEGQYRRAVIYFEALVILDPSSAYDKQTLGAIYLELDEYQKAIDVLEAALLLEPDHLATQLNQAKAYIGLGELQKGITLIKNLITCDEPSIASDAEALLLAYQ